MADLSAAGQPLAPDTETPDTEKDAAMRVEQEPRALSPGQEQRALWLLSAILLTSVIPMSIILPMLPGIAHTYDATPLETSALFTLFPFLTFFAAPFWGQLSDKIGRKPVLLISLVGAALGFGAFALADSLEMLFAARALQGVMSGNATIAFAIVSDVTPPERRTAGIGRISGSFALGFVVGPLLGSFFIAADAASFDHSPPSLFGTACLAVAALVAALFMPESRPRAVREAGHGNALIKFGAVGVLLSDKRLIMLAVLYLANGVLSSIVTFNYTLWAADIAGWGPRYISYGFIGIGAALMIANFVLVGHLSRWFGDQRTFLIAVLIQAAGLTLFLLTDSIAIATPALLITVLGDALGMTVLASLMTRAAPSGQQGGVLGISSGMNMAGRVMGPNMGGILYSEIGYRAPFALCLAIAIGVAAWAFRRVTAPRRRAEPAE